MTTQSEADAFAGRHDIQLREAIRLIRVHGSVEAAEEFLRRKAAGEIPVRDVLGRPRRAW